MQAPSGMPSLRNWEEELTRSPYEPSLLAPNLHWFLQPSPITIHALNVSQESFPLLAKMGQ